MHENGISEKIICAAIEVHRILGPGLLESVYEGALCHELHLRGLHFKRQQYVPIPYKGIKLGTDLRLDLLVEDKVIVDLKAKEELSTIAESLWTESPEVQKHGLKVLLFWKKIYYKPQNSTSFRVRY